jgi:hypothetical protein
MRTLALPVLAAAALATGCYTTHPVGGVAYSATYVGPGPAMVHVAPGVQVISDWDYPVFYADNMYWMYDNGYWYQSRMYNGGWAMSYNVPGHVRGIQQPHRYVRYRGQYGTHVRDHRQPYYRTNRGAGTPPPPAYGAPGHRPGGPAYRPAGPPPGHRPGAAPPPAYRGAPAARPAPARSAPPPRGGGPTVRDHRRR